MSGTARGTDTRWRIGRKVPINMYDGDRPVCQTHTALDARRIVDSVNKMIELIHQGSVIVGALAAIKEAWQRSVVTGPVPNPPTPLPSQMIEQMADEILALREMLAKELGHG